jgi:hypothetical protein
VTVVGEGFGALDNSPLLQITGVSAAFTEWISTSTLVCKLPACSACTASIAETAIVILAGQTSKSLDMSYNYIVP